jgi:hypothetical protein
MIEPVLTQIENTTSGVSALAAEYTTIQQLVGGQPFATWRFLEMQARIIAPAIQIIKHSHTTSLPSRLPRKGSRRTGQGCTGHPLEPLNAQAPSPGNGPFMAGVPACC